MTPNYRHAVKENATVLSNFTKSQSRILYTLKKPLLTQGVGGAWWQGWFVAGRRCRKGSELWKAVIALYWLMSFRKESCSLIQRSGKARYAIFMPLAVEKTKVRVQVGSSFVVINI